MKTNTINLGDILFVTEAAQTPETALEKNVGLIIGKDDIGIDCILFSIDKIHSFLESDLAIQYSNTQDIKSGKLIQQYRRTPGQRTAWLIEQLAYRTIVGLVGADEEIPKLLYSVGNSAAVNKFGPLTYEILMAAIYPAYLHSDDSLTKYSRSLWNKMYARSDVERKWLGEFDNHLLQNGLSATELPQRAHSIIRATSNTLDDNETTILSKFPPNYKDRIGPLYAYRMAPSQVASNQYTTMLRAGEEAIEEIAGQLNRSVEQIERLFTKSAMEFFQRRYNWHS